MIWYPNNHFCWRWIIYILIYPIHTHLPYACRIVVIIDWNNQNWIIVICIIIGWLLYDGILLQNPLGFWVGKLEQVQTMLFVFAFWYTQFVFEILCFVGVVTKIYGDEIFFFFELLHFKRLRESKRITSFRHL